MIFQHPSKVNSLGKTFFGKKVLPNPFQETLLVRRKLSSQNSPKKVAQHFFYVTIRIYYCEDKVNKELRNKVKVFQNKKGEAKDAREKVADCDGAGAGYCYGRLCRLHRGQ
jgi:hypothetical protein